MALILGLSRCADAFVYGFTEMRSRFSSLITSPSTIPFTELLSSTSLQQTELTSLPVELKLHVLGFIADVPTLRNLCLASREFYDLSMQDATIIGDALYRELGMDNFLEAYLVVSAANMRCQYTDDAEKVQAFFKKRHHIFQSTNGLGTLSLEETQQMSRLLDRVRYFVTDYAKLAFQIVEARDLSGLDHNDLTATEIKRITRALLRTALCCELFPFQDMDIPLSVEEDLKFEFLRYYPAWQCEELVCIRQYLISRMIPIFQDVQNEYSKDPLVFVRMTPGDYEELKGPLPQGFKYIPEDWVPEWFNASYDGGVNLVEHSSLVSDVRQGHLLPMIQNRQIAEGLEHLYRLFTATTATDRVSIFETAFSLMSYNGKEHGMFDDCEYQNTGILRKSPPAAEAYFHEDLEEFNFEEGGLNAGWCWAHGNKFYPFFNEPEKMRERHLGYVMWDKQRLESWNILERVPPATQRYCQLFSADQAHECQRTQLNKSVDPETVTSDAETPPSPTKNDLRASEHDDQPGPTVDGTIGFEQVDEDPATEIVVDIHDTKDSVPIIEHNTNSEPASHANSHLNNTNDAEQSTKQDCTAQCTVPTAIEAAEDGEVLEDDTSTSSKSNSPRSIFSSFSSPSDSPPSSGSDPDSPKAPCWKASSSEINIDFTSKKSTIPVRRIKAMRQRTVQKVDNVVEHSSAISASKNESKPSPAFNNEPISASAEIDTIPQKQISGVETEQINKVKQIIVETEMKEVQIEAIKYSVDELAAWIEGKPLPNKQKAGKWSKKNSKKKSKKSQVA